MSCVRGNMSGHGGHGRDQPDGLGQLPFDFDGLVVASCSGAIDDSGGGGTVVSRVFGTRGVLLDGIEVEFFVDGRFDVLLFFVRGAFFLLLALIGVQAGQFSVFLKVQTAV